MFQITFTGDDSDAYLGPLRALKDFVVEITYYKDWQKVKEPFYIEQAAAYTLYLRRWDKQTGEAGEAVEIEIENIEEVEVV